MSFNLTQIVNKLVNVQIKGSDYKVPVDLQDHMIPTSNPIPVSVQGQSSKTAQEIVLINALAITDTVAHSSGDIDVSNMAGQKNIMVYNTLNQTANVNIFVKVKSGLLFQVIVNSAVTTGNVKVFTDVDIPILKGPFQFVRVTLTCSTAPTSGTASVFLNGVGA